MTTPRLQKIEVTNWGLEITYLEDADIHQPTGIRVVKLLQFPHEVLDQRLIDDLYEAVVEIIEDAATKVRAPDDAYLAPR